VSRSARGRIFSDLDLWLARLPGFCLLTATQDAVDRRLVSPTSPMTTPALAEAADRFADQIRIWDRDHA
jgi:hypothetical protein